MLPALTLPHDLPPWLTAGHGIEEASLDFIIGKDRLDKQGLFCQTCHL